jgi:hypothetical protein
MLAAERHTRLRRCAGDFDEGEDKVNGVPMTQIKGMRAGMGGRLRTREESPASKTMGDGELDRRRRGGLTARPVQGRGRIKDGLREFVAVILGTENRLSHKSCGCGALPKILKIKSA